ncbi:MAG: carbohydrate kinase family protein [Acidobacteriaceae bacterium]|nr:carbohydrate kinase family protein [Acidobacteriaceae bacterium]
MKGVLCSGNLVYDIVVRPVDQLHWGSTTFVDCIEFHVGGNGANTSRALGILGVPTRLLGAVGNDENATFLLERLAAAGVNTSRVERLSCRTAATVAVVSRNGERKFFHQLGASNEALQTGIDFTPELCSGIAHYHMASLFVLPAFRSRGRETLARARALGLTTSFDSNWDPQGAWMRDLEPCLPYIDFLFMNEPETEMMTGSTDAAIAARVVLEKRVRTVVLKLGASGCAIYTADREWRCPAFEVEVKDTTGAGDSFAAGFITALLNDASLPDAGQFANAVAGLSVQRVGAVNGVLPQSETEAWMRTARLRT